MPRELLKCVMSLSALWQASCHALPPIGLRPNLFAKLNFIQLQLTLCFFPFSKLNSTDSVFIMAFAIILLNTDLHTPNLKPEKRMKPEDFIRNLRGIDEGCDVDVEMLNGVYERIRASEFRSGSDHVTQVSDFLFAIT